MPSTVTEAVKAALAGANDYVDPPPGTDDEKDYVYDIFALDDEGEEEAPHEAGAEAGSFMTITLQWCGSGSIFTQVQVEAKDWGTVILGADKAWSCVPTHKLWVVRDDGMLPLEGLFLAPAPEACLSIYVKPAAFKNALDQQWKLRNGERRWRKEFKQHVAETFYRVPAHWRLDVQTQDFWILRMVQVWAREIRIRFRPDIRPWIDPDEIVFLDEDFVDLRYVGRFRHGVTELMADTWGWTDRHAESEFEEFEALNMTAHMSLTQLLWTDEHQFHCFVR